MRRSALISFLSLLLVFACVLPGLAETGKLNLIFIGGDSDTEENKNNLFRNILLNNEVKPSSSSPQAGITPMLPPFSARKPQQVTCQRTV